MMLSHIAGANQDASIRLKTPHLDQADGDFLYAMSIQPKGFETGCRIRGQRGESISQNCAGHQTGDLNAAANKRVEHDSV
jgi:hypothetical protein